MGAILAGIWVALIGFLVASAASAVIEWRYGFDDAASVAFGVPDVLGALRYTWNDFGSEFTWAIRGGAALTIIVLALSTWGLAPRTARMAALFALVAVAGFGLLVFLEAELADDLVAYDLSFYRPGSVVLACLGVSVVGVGLGLLIKTLARRTT